MKKGAIEIQFNWLFTIIAGGLILLFFFGIINWARGASDENLAATIGTHLDALFTSSAVSERTVTTIGDLGYRSLEIGCDDFRVSESENSRALSALVLSPGNLPRGSLVLWSESWDAPMLVDRFLLVSTPAVRYMIFGDIGDPVYDLLLDRFPEELRAEHNPSVIRNEGHEQVRAIYANPSTMSTNWLDEFKRHTPAEVTAVELNGDDVSVTATYHLKTPSSVNPQAFREEGTVSVYGEGAILGATLAGGSDELRCQMNKAKDRLGRVAAIHRARAAMLRDHYQQTTDFACMSIMSDAVTAFDGLVSDTPTAATRLSELNTQAQRSSCAYLY